MKVLLVAAMDDFGYLQPILGTDKKNPVFSVYKHSESKQYHVYYGLELFEVVPWDHEDTRFKLMVAHLRNVGAKLGALHEAFGVDPRTIRKWSAALKSGDAQKLIQALAGRNACRKLTPAVEQFVRLRFESIYAEDRYTYSRKIRKELKEFLQVDLSGETLRPLLGELKAQVEEAQPSSAQGAPLDEPDGEPGQESTDDDTAAPCESEPSKPRTSEAAAEFQEGDESEESAHDREKLLEKPHSNERSALENRRRHTNFSDTRWCSHLGLLLFSQPLLSLEKALEGSSVLAVRQWISQVLLGALNLEQTKLISGGDLEHLLGSGLLGGPDHQRRKLGELAAEPNLARKILRWNFHRLGGAEQSDFFYDPHTKHYTGKQNVLKGWCPKIRWADKVMHADFVHSRSGQPLYLENTDNYEDMRKRFVKMEERFRESFDIAEGRELTWIIDRGIFGDDIFQWILQCPEKHLITWEKGYQRDAWPEERVAEGSMSVERARNDSEDLRSYHFEWIEHPWPKEPKVRRIVVRATNPEGNWIEVSILCDDWARSARTIIWPMFDRWVQENDFKYLDTHFGINEITSYQSESYAQLQDQLEDRQMKNGAYAALEAERRAEKKRLGALLVRERNAQRSEQTRAQRVAVLKAVSQLSQEQRQELGRLKTSQKNAQRYRRNRETKIEETQERIDQWEAKLQSTTKEVSRLDTLISKSAVRMRGEKKHLMDVIKITARNLFYEILEPFKEAYDNYRDDHVWFRHLTQSGGIIEPAGEGALRCHLIGTADYPKPVRKVVESLLAEFNKNNPHLPDGSNRQIRLLLGSKSAIELAPPKA